MRGNPYEFNALTAIDTVTNLVELVRIDDREILECLLNFPLEKERVKKAKETEKIGTG